MKISTLLNQGVTTISFEVFPPKTSDRLEVVTKATEEIARLHPDFMSVTYGAGGGTSKYTVSIAENLQKTEKVPMLAHLTCVSSDKAHVRRMIEMYREHGIENIMALRGDIPEDGRKAFDYHYATELIYDIRSLGDFCIGGACYPEGHPESENRRNDLIFLKAKVDAGLDFLTSQMFFNNDVFYNFLYRARDIGIKIPIIAGIMPIINARQIKRSIALSGTEFPERFRAITDHFGADDNAMMRAGIIYASEQIIDLLAHGVNNIHVYSMNRPEVAKGIRDALSGIL